jgi:hypothetical protein
MILLKFTRETFKTNPVLSDEAGSDATVKRCNQVAIEVAPNLRRSVKAGRDTDCDFLKGLGRAGAVVKFPFDVPEGLGPQSLGEFSNARINGAMMTSIWPNPKRRYPVRVRGERLVFCMSAHRNDPYRIADTARSRRFITLQEAQQLPLTEIRVATPHKSQIILTRGARR